MSRAASIDTHPLDAEYAALHAAIAGVVRASAQLPRAAAARFVGDDVHLSIASDAYRELLALRRATSLLELHFADLTWRYTKPQPSTPPSPAMTNQWRRCVAIAG